MLYNFHSSNLFNAILHTDNATTTPRLGTKQPNGKVVRRRSLSTSPPQSYFHPLQRCVIQRRSPERALYLVSKVHPIFELVESLLTLVSLSHRG
ncbi:MAG: hypothetical protein N3E45_12720 [Oscillatoriaceae bacterium SKW80]|nr:hypothetical protein [Oscillatoriaceae bacterium SKYG93]MCX8121664.1 hypothetical protein [Oscillatoriaceae bacterium SKW80]MDW8453972.1 hypothetical protein [Oscillatoriaceae cyanobacterium SKYGB_i_bin93]HIK28783.1 hypothetical protein [Oscillatoriaceae cyanobacterium M7585_C2015_266]